MELENSDRSLRNWNCFDDATPDSAVATKTPVRNAQTAVTGWRFGLIHQALKVTEQTLDVNVRLQQAINQFNIRFNLASHRIKLCTAEPHTSPVSATSRKKLTDWPNHKTRPMIFTFANIKALVKEQKSTASKGNSEDSTDTSWITAIEYVLKWMSLLDRPELSNKKQQWAHRAAITTSYFNIFPAFIIDIKRISSTMSQENHSTLFI